MKKLILTSLLLLTGCNSATQEYRKFLNKNKSTIKFHCKDNSLISEFFVDKNAIKSIYRVVIVNNKTVDCYEENGFIVIPDLNLRVEE